MPARSIQQVQGYERISATARTVAASKIVLDYDVGTTYCFGGGDLRSSETTSVTPGILGSEHVPASVEGLLGMFKVAQATALSNQTIALQLQGDGPGHGTGVLLVRDAGEWPRANITTAAGTNAIAQDVITEPDPPAPWTAPVPYVDAWPSAGPSGTYAYLHITGALDESGPAYVNNIGCGVSLRSFEEDGAQRSMLTIPESLGTDPRRTEIVVADFARIHAIADSGCGSGEQLLALATTNGTVQALWGTGPTAIGLERRGDTVLVNGTALAAGESRVLHVHFVLHQDHGSGPADYAYDGDLTVTLIGSWERSGIHLRPYGWL